jgi:hypothetical protein
MTYLALSFELSAFSLELYAMLYALCALRSFVKRANLFRDDTGFGMSKVKSDPKVLY